MPEAIRRWIPIAATAAGVSVAVASLLNWSRCACTDLPPADAAVAAGTGLLFVLVGAAAWLRPDTARVGALMSAVGVTWFARTLIWVPNSVAFTSGFLVANVWDVLLAHLVVAFPSGRLHGRLDRLVVGLVYLLYLPARLVEMMFGTPVPIPHAASNLLLLWPNERLADLGVSLFTAYAIVMTLAVLAVVLGHWLRATPFGRRTLAQVIWASLLTAGCIIAINLLGLDRSSLLVIGVAAVALGLLIGLIRTGLDHAAVSRLVIDLGKSHAGGDLQGALARALHDPSLTLAYWLPQRAGYVDSAGHPVALPGGGSERAVAVLQSAGQPIGALIHDAGLEYDTKLLEATTAAARLAVEHERFRAQLQDQLAEVRASRARILAATNAERRRIERNLHEGAQQRLARMSQALTRARAVLREGDDPYLDRALREVAADAGAAADELRALAQGVHPAVLSEAGLGPALESLAARLPLAVTIRELPRGTLPAAVEAAAYFVIAEALTNVVKHAAASAVTVTVRYEHGIVLAEVGDDGVGGAVSRRGSGLQGMADRVAGLDGRLEVVSPAGGGTLVRLALPSPPPALGPRPPGG
jgi:signal transduction histidine kinase